MQRSWALPKPTKSGSKLNRILHVIYVHMKIWQVLLFWVLYLVPSWGGEWSPYHQAGCQLNSDTTWRHIRSHRLRAQFCKTGAGHSPKPLPQYLWWLIASPDCHAPFWLTSYETEVPPKPSLGSINLLEQLAELKKPVYSLDCWFITENVKGYRSTARWKDTLGEVPKELLSWNFGPGIVALGSILVPILEALRTPSFVGFYGGLRLPCIDLID